MLCDVSNDVREKNATRKRNLCIYTFTVVCFIPVCVACVWSEEVKPLFSSEIVQNWYFGGRDFTNELLDISPPKYIFSTPNISNVVLNCSLDHPKSRVIVIPDEHVSEPLFSSALCARSRGIAAVIHRNKDSTIKWLNEFYHSGRRPVNEPFCTMDQLALSSFIPNGNFTDVSAMNMMLETISRHFTFLNIDNEYHQQLSYNICELKDLRLFYNRVIAPRLPTAKRDSRILQRTINFVVVKAPDNYQGHYIDRSQNVLLIMYQESEADSLCRKGADMLAEFCDLLGDWTELEQKAIDSAHRIVVDGKFQRLELTKAKRRHFLQCMQRKGHDEFVFTRVTSCIEELEASVGDKLDEFVASIFTFPPDQKVGIYIPLFFPILTALAGIWISILRKKHGVVSKEKKE